MLPPSNEYPFVAAIPAVASVELAVTLTVPLEICDGEYQILGVVGATESKIIVSFTCVDSLPAASLYFT